MSSLNKVRILHFRSKICSLLQSFCDEMLEILNSDDQSLLKSGHSGLYFIALLINIGLNADSPLVHRFRNP